MKEDRQQSALKNDESSSSSSRGIKAELVQAPNGAIINKEFFRYYSEAFSETPQVTFLKGEAICFPLIGILCILLL